jgi:hypothetical protein
MVQGKGFQSWKNDEVYKSAICPYRNCIQFELLDQYLTEFCATKLTYYFSLWLYDSHVVSTLKTEFCYGMKFINLYMSKFETKWA